MDWELVQQAPTPVLEHVIEEYEKMQERLGITERALQIASEAVRERTPHSQLPDAPEGEDGQAWEDYWRRRAKVALVTA